MAERIPPEMHPDTDYPPPARRSFSGQVRALGLSLAVGLLAAALAAGALSAISLSVQTREAEIGVPIHQTSGAIFVKRGAPKRTLLPVRPPTDNVPPPPLSPLLSPIVIEWIPFDDEEDEFPFVTPHLWGWQGGWEV